MIHIGGDEKVVYEIRRHWFVFLAESFFLIVLFFVPWVIFSVFDVFGSSVTGDAGALFVFITTAWLFILWMLFLIRWTNYYLDVWIVTNKRIIDVEQHSLFSRDVSEFRLDRVQDITIEIKGVLATLLHFGDIHVQTAGESREFTIKRVPKPYKVKDMLVRAQNSAILEPRTLPKSSQR